MGEPKRARRAAARQPDILADVATGGLRIVLSSELDRVSRELDATQAELARLKIEAASLRAERDALRREAGDCDVADAEARVAEDQARQIAALRQTDTLKDQFLSILSHELRTPINAIMGFGSILDDGLAGELTDEQRRYLRRMLGGAESMLALVNDLLDMSRIQSGKFSLAPDLIHLDHVSTHVIENLRPLAEQKRQALIDDVPRDLVALVADSQRLGQIVTNLVSNAIKFTPEGGRVRVAARPAGNRLRVEVSDTGVGIAPGDLPKLFQRFSQLDMGNTRQAAGTGLGLSIVKALVEAHGGQVGVESRRGQGSTFWFELPLAGPPAAPPETIRKRPHLILHIQSRSKRRAERMTDAKWGGARVGAGRKPREAGSPRKAISVTLSQAAYAALCSHAEERGCSLSEACEALIMRGGPWELAAVVPAAQGTEVDA